MIGENKLLSVISILGTALAICMIMVIVILYVVNTASFKPDVSEAQVKEVEDAFCKLPSQIDLIKGYEWGTDCSPEGLQQGLTHCFFLTFHSDADRDAYLVHPAHKAFGKVLGGKASAVTVLDYWTK